MQQCRQRNVSDTDCDNELVVVVCVVNREEESFLNQLTESLCPIPIITYPQDVLMAVHREPEQKKDRKDDSRNIRKNFQPVKGRSCETTDLFLCGH